MKTRIKPLPSLEELNRILTLDRQTGHLFWKFRDENELGADRRSVRIFNSNYGGKRADHVLGNGGYTYIRIRVGGKQAIFAAHRIVWKMVNGRDPFPFIDHIDRDRANNHPSNLREATQSENMRNRDLSVLKRRRVSDRQVGIYPTKSGRFRAQISRYGRIHHFGTFDSAAEAAAAIEAFRSNDFGQREAA